MESGAFVIVGSGGREHALGLALASEGARLVVEGSNPGLARLTSHHLPVDVAPERLAATLPGATLLIGPEAPLFGGMADRARALGVATFGPSLAASRLEGDRAFARELLARLGAPQPAWRAAVDVEAALLAVRELGPDAVVKFNGPASGKGTLPLDPALAAEGQLRELASRLGVDGPWTIEARLHGEEASLLALCDGRRAVLLGHARDHKALEEGGLGPLTGGMGALSPAPALDGPTTAAVMARVVAPVVEAMAAAGTPFIGCLFVGLMVEGAAPAPGAPRPFRVLELNARLGDPETQALLPRLAEPLAPWLAAAARGELPSHGPRLNERLWSLAAVLAAPGYPRATVLGGELRGLEALPAGCELLCAGLVEREGRSFVAGGRVLALRAVDEERESCRRRVLEAMAGLRLEGSRFRSDLGAA